MSKYSNFVEAEKANRCLYIFICMYIARLEKFYKGEAHIYFGFCLLEQVAGTYSQRATRFQGRQVFLCWGGASGAGFFSCGPGLRG